MARELHTARLTQKTCISDPAQCFHLEYVIEGLDQFAFKPGQFVSLVKEDSRGKMQTRAYSIASAPRANAFDLCVNRVEGGFFSNLLADMEEGDPIGFHGPHGLFTLRQPLTDAILIATGTGIAPMRGFIEHLFPDNGRSLSSGRKIWLVYGTRYPTELYYREFFERKAAEHEDFEYITTLSRAEADWTGPAGLRAGACRQDRNRASFVTVAGHADGSRRRTRLQHPRLHLRSERYGLREPRTTDQPWLGQEADHL